MASDQEEPITGSRLWKPHYPVTFTCENDHKVELSFWEDDTGECPRCAAEILDVTFFTDDIGQLRELLRGLEWRASTVDSEESPERKREMARELFDGVKSLIDRDT